MAARVRALIRDEALVTLEQRQAIAHKGNYLLLACPGSGKTRTVAFRSAYWATSECARMTAATTYTNVAVSEIKRATALTGVPIIGPHFLGTLHSFLLRYVVYPFVHLIDGAPRNVKVLHRGRWATPPKPLGFRGESGAIAVEDFVFRADGRLVLENVPPTFSMSAAEVLEAARERALRVKRALLGRGLLSSSDAMYVAMQILEQRQDLAAAVAGRFDELIVDEVQDCSDVQLRCVRLLRETNGLRSLVLIGDLNQAIYGWLGGVPEAVTALADDSALVRLALTRNFRSSQAICNQTYRFVGRAQPDVASGPYRHYGVRPEVITYDGRNATAAVGVFDARLKELGIKVADTVVLTRGWTLAGRISGGSATSASQGVSTLLAAAAQRTSGQRITREAVQAVDSLVATILYGDGSRLADASELRPLTMEILERLPALEGDLGSWAQGACAAVRMALSDRDFSKQPGDLIRKRRGNENVVVEDYVARLSAQPRAQVVHAVKGESHDGVLLVAPTPRGDRNPAGEWVKALRGAPADEESRIAYVALTRARKYDAIALPLPHCKDEMNLLLDAGWEPAARPT